LFEFFGILPLLQDSLARRRNVIRQIDSLTAQFFHPKMFGNEQVIIRSANVRTGRVLTTLQAPAVDVILQAVVEILRLADIRLSRVQLILELIDPLILVAVMHKNRRLACEYIVRVLGSPSLPAFSQVKRRLAVPLRCVFGGGCSWLLPSPLPSRV
jgi:hypothetical protein